MPESKLGVRIFLVNILYRDWQDSPTLDMIISWNVHYVMDYMISGIAIHTVLLLSTGVEYTSHNY